MEILNLHMRKKVTIYCLFWIFWYQDQGMILKHLFTTNQLLMGYLFIYSFFNIDNYRRITIYNKNSSKMLIDVNTLVKNKENKTIEHKTFYIKRWKIK